MNIAVIPARGGSKRIPRKNVKDFCGKPMIAYSIEAALASGCFDRVIVSTDDEEIANVAQAYGAEVPFMRPAQLSDDHTGTIPVIKHATEWFMAQGLAPDLVCCLYATAPFVTAEHLQQGLQQMQQTDAAYAFTVTSYAFPIQRAIKIDDQQRMQMFNPDAFNTRSQDLEEAWHDAGQFYWGKAASWLAEMTIFGEASSPIILPRHRVQDIDTSEDWDRAEWLFRALKS